MEKLGNRQTKDHIAELLRGEILSGRMADGEELAQEQLAERLAVSRMPVREALQMLELEGLLLRLPNRHVQVVGRRARTVDENLRLVAAVEAEIALIGAEQGSLPPDEADIFDDRQFHQSISDRSENPYLRQAHRRLLQGYPDYIWRKYPPGAFKAQNQAICAAMKAQDAEAIRRNIHQYYRDLARALPDVGEELTREQPEAD